MVPSDVDETLEWGPLTEAVARLALRKARAVAVQVGVGIVVGADTIVVIDGMPLGKPSSPEEARRMLVRLRGREHEVMTGVAVVDGGSGRAASATTVSRVLMAAYSDATIEAYVASGSPLDKAGAYAIQETADRFVVGMTGDFTNVVGLPLSVVERLLRESGAVPGTRT